jgi:hypothetical protein
MKRFLPRTDELFKKHASKMLIMLLLVLTCSPANAQVLEWAYSFKNPVVIEEMTDFSSNGQNRFALIGRGNSGISMDPIGLSTVYASPGSFIALYNELAQIQWVKPTVDFAFGVMAASGGAVYVTGSFTGTKDFDPSGNTAMLTATGYDTYLQKFNSDGSFAWAAKASAEGTPGKMTLLSDGRIIVAGRSDVDASVTLSNSSVVNLSKGVYLLEFSPAGDLTKASCIAVPGASGYAYVYDITSDSNNNIYVAGALDGIADFDPGSGVSNNTATNTYDAYVVKYNALFELQWFRKFGDSNNPGGWDKARGIAVDASGNVYAAGEFTWNTDFDPSNPGTFSLVSDPASQMPSGFILQWDAAGTLNWVKKIGNTNNGMPSSSANVSIVGLELQPPYLYTAMEGFGYWDVDPAATNHILDVGAIAHPGIGFAKYTLDGNYVSAFSIDTTFSGSGIYTLGLNMLGAGNVITAGKFSKLLDFDPGSGIHILQTDVNGPFYGFDNDLYIGKYSFGGSSGIAGSADNLGIQPFPNPFRDEIRISNLSGEAIQQIQIIDATGRVVLSDAGKTEFLATDHLGSGLYIIDIQTTTNRFVRQKLVKL